VTVGALALSTILYGLGVRRYDAAHPGRPFPRVRVAAFLTGMAALAVVLVGPIERLADAAFTWHMVQHLAVTMVVAPLLLMGRPVTLARRSRSARVRRAVLGLLRSRWAGRLGHPAVGWAAFALALWATHFTSLYQGALDSPAVHALEHGLLLGTSVLFWLPVVGTEPTRHRLGPPARILYVTLAAGASALLASTLLQADRILYPAYAGPEGLADQRAAAAVMWIAGGLLFLVAVLVVAWRWARAERRAPVTGYPTGAGSGSTRAAMRSEGSPRRRSIAYSGTATPVARPPSTKPSATDRT
jgi:putative copper resistance protein D